MPITKSAIKEVRAARRKQVSNKGIRTLAKSNVSKAEDVIAGGDVETAKKAAVLAVSALDRAAEKNIIHRNNAGRRKSRLMKKLNKMQAAPAKKT